MNWFGFSGREELIAFSYLKHSHGEKLKDMLLLSVKEAGKRYGTEDVPEVAVVAVLQHRIRLFMQEKLDEERIRCDYFIAVLEYEIEVLDFDEIAKAIIYGVNLNFDPRKHFEDVMKTLPKKSDN